MERSKVWEAIVGCMVVMLVTIFILNISGKPSKSAYAAGQTAANTCATGQVVTSQLVNTGQSCSVTAAPLGAYVSQIGMNSATPAQTVCDTSSSCPAGYYVVFVYINPVSTGTLVSSTTGTISFTDDVGVKNNVAMGGSISLLSTSPGSYAYSFYHAAGTTVTVGTTVNALTGNPSYNFRARLVWLGA